MHARHARSACTICSLYRAGIAHRTSRETVQRRATLHRVIPTAAGPVSSHARTCIGIAKIVWMWNRSTQGRDVELPISP